MSSPSPADPAVEEQQNIQEKEIDTQDATSATIVEEPTTANLEADSLTIPTAEAVAEAAAAVIETQSETAIEAITTTFPFENKENVPQYDVITEEYDSSQRQVNDLIASLRMDLLTSRSEVATLYGKVNSLTAENISLKIKNQGISNFEAANKLQIEQMEDRLDNLKQKESEYHQKILELEQEQSLLKDQKQKQYHDHIAEMSTLKNERDALTQKNINLQLELSKIAAESKSAKTEQKTLEQRCKELELNRLGDAKAHEDMIAVYEKQQKENQAQLQNYIAAEARARQEAASIEERLQKENDDLKQKLVETEDRLSIIRLRSDGASPSQQQIGNTTTLPDGRQSNLIHLMRQYEEGGNSWECIYEDYFELKEAHIKAVKQCEAMGATNEQLMREQRDKEQRYRRMEVEHRRLNAETEAVRERARRAEAAQNENGQVVCGLHDKISKLQSKNNDLEKSLNEVAYQLQHVIHDVESRNELLPAGVRSSSDLLQYASQTPGFNTTDLVFNNVKELQEQNQKLLERIRKFDDQLKEKTREVERLGREGLATEEKYTLALNRAEETIKDLNYNVISLQQRLDATVKQRDMYKLGTSEVNEHVHNNIPNTRSTQSQEEESASTNESAEDEAYRYAMQEDMKQLQTELKEAQNAATASNTRLKTTEAEIAKLRKECQNLLRSQALRSSDLKSLRTRNADLERLLADNEQNLTNYTNDFAIYRQKQESLRAENITLRSQLDFSDNLHKKAIQDNESLSSRCAQLTGLLQNMTSKNKSNTGVQSDGIEFLKKQIEAQDKELENLRLRLDNAQQGLTDSDIGERDHWKNKYNEVHRELQRLNGSQLELQKELAAAKEQRITLETKLALLEKKNAGNGGGEPGSEEEEKEQQQGEEGVNFEAQYTELAAANMEMEKLRLQITDYEEQLEKQRQEADKLSKEHDEFTTDMQSKLVKLNQELSDRDGMIKAAQTATEDIQRLKLERAEAEQQWAAAKNSLNAEKEKLEQRVNEYEEEASRLRQQIETQTELINEGKEKLELEINSHADDTETIKSLREDTSRLTQDITTANAELATLQSQLRISEESWTKQKEQWEVVEKRLKAELESSTKRFDDLLETLSAKQNDETTEQSTTESGDTPIPTDVANKSDEQLQLLVVSIRQKNEMLQRQYKAALSKVDQVRSDLQFAQTQVASLKAQVEVVRTQNVEIENKYQEAARKAKDEAIVYKENNTQLRATITDLRTQLSTLDKQATESKASVEPLTDKVANLEAQIKAQVETIEQLEKSKLEWSTRTAQIMSKYNKLDPAEIENAKQERDAAKAQMEVAEKAKAEAESKLKELTAIENAKTEAESKLKEKEEEYNSTKSKLDDVEAKVKKIQGAAVHYKKKYEESLALLKSGTSGTSTPNAAAEQQKKELERKTKELEAVEEKLKTALEEKKTTETALQQKTTQHQDLQEKHKGLLAKSRTIIDNNRRTHEEALNKLREELKTSTENLNKSTEELNQLKEENKKANEQLEEAIKEKNRYEMELQRNKVKISLDQNKITKLTKELNDYKKRAREEDGDGEAVDQPATKIQKQENAE